MKIGMFRMRAARLTPAAGFYFAIASLVLGAGEVTAGEVAGSAPPSAKRQLHDCMLKRMNDDRTLSYNDASKACKDQLRDGKTDAALRGSNLPTPVS